MTLRDFERKLEYNGYLRAIGFQRQDKNCRVFLRNQQERNRYRTETYSTKVTIEPAGQGYQIAYYPDTKKYTTYSGWLNKEAKPVDSMSADVLKKLNLEEIAGEAMQ